ncbi:MAG TPA: hypothetical protein VFG49_14250 [Dyella sp.]|uniref:hypothetical protein n=1 Tax=Dyella sp. TaxID=1869338 RepID=UPI002D78C23D|nr:hypothetical protein [Dyella sp.]HET6554685.1 hypothetical protein [Dyella sp.]
MIVVFGKESLASATQALFAPSIVRAFADGANPTARAANAAQQITGESAPPSRRRSLAIIMLITT